MRASHELGITMTERVRAILKEYFLHRSQHPAIAKLPNDLIPIRRGGKSDPDAEPLHVLVVDGDTILERHLDQVHPGFAQALEPHVIHAS